MGEQLDELISKYEGLFSRIDSQEWEKGLPRWEHDPLMSQLALRRNRNIVV
jgi:hypothetical protein